MKQLQHFAHATAAEFACHAQTFAVYTVVPPLPPYSLNY